MRSKKTSSTVTTAEAVAELAALISRQPHLLFEGIQAYAGQLSHEADGAYIVDFSGGIVSDGRTKSILENGVTRKEGDDVLLPLDEKNTTFIAYSKNGKDGVWNIPHAPFRDAAVFRITPAGNVPCGTVGIADGTIALKIEPGQAMVIRAAD